MSDDSKVFIVCATLLAAFVGGCAFLLHLNEVRSDAARMECIKQGRVWSPSPGSSTHFTCLGKQ